MKQILYCLVFVSLLLFFSTSAESLPRFALRQGVKCMDCHLNPTGGSLRNAFGSSYSRENVPLMSTRDEKFKFNPEVSENITLGGDFRMQLIYDPEAKGTAFEGKGASVFQTMQGALYAGVGLTSKIDFFFKYDFVNSGSSFTIDGRSFIPFEAFAIARILPNDSYIKIGNFLPNYGLRLDDHTAYVRGGNLGYLANLPPRGLLFVPNYRDLGVEAGIYFDNFLVNLAVLSGDPSSTFSFGKDRALNARIEYTPTVGGKANLMLGGSYYNYTGNNITMLGGFAGVSVDRFTLLGEVDVVKNNSRLPADTTTIYGNSLAAFAELDVLIIQGLTFTVRYDLFDPDTKIDNTSTAPSFSNPNFREVMKNHNSLSRIIIGFEFFPYSFFELRPQFRINTEEPSVDNNTFLLQTHFWF
jgi:hypothetical protein